mgnify:CR=1 FL=1
MENKIEYTELPEKYSEILNRCLQTNEPIFITANGKPDTVLMSTKRFNQMIEEAKSIQ